MYTGPKYNSLESKAVTGYFSSGQNGYHAAIKPQTTYQTFSSELESTIYKENPQPEQKRQEYSTGGLNTYDDLLMNQLTKDYDQDKHQTYTHSWPNHFLNPDRPITRFIGQAEDIKDLIEETFEKTTGQKLPDHIIINVMPKEKLKSIHSEHSKHWSDGILGFALNRRIPEIFIMENNLDLLMLTIGHELGHVFTEQLSDKHDEEAKAFAFEMAWVKTIIEHNIGELKENFDLDIKPAQNGLHNIAFNFVKEILKKGKKALDIYNELVEGTLQVNNNHLLEYGVKI